VLSKTDGKKTKYVNIPKAEDANEAGGPNSHKCRLIICEGDSAKNYALECLDYREGGRDYIGIYPISGKIINVVNASMDQLIKNKQITELKTILGLVTDADLMNDENYYKLRYGTVEIMTDADGDGSHIRGLLMLFLAMGFPGFLFRECLQTWLTPLVRATRTKTNVLSFYTMKEFSDWKKQQTEDELRKWKIKYYKGLGSSDTSEIKEDCEKSKLLIQTMGMDDKETLMNALVAWVMIASTCLVLLPNSQQYYVSMSFPCF
jgi:DNA topoisomerase-2